MYLEHFDLREAPFAITPDPRFVFLSERHREALAHLRYGIAQGGSGGFVLLTGDIGTGKTTLSRLLLEQLPPGTQAALLLNPRVTALELLENLCEELGLTLPATARGSVKQLVDLLNLRHRVTAHSAALLQACGTSRRPSLTSTRPRIDHFGAADTVDARLRQCS